MSRIALRQLGIRALVIAAAAVTVPLLAQQPAAAVTNVDVGSGNLVAEEFEHSNYGGADLRLFLPFDCTTTGADTDFGFANMPSTWNNVVSSFKNYRNCDADHYDGTGFSGNHTGLADSTTYIGNAMNDKTSSLKYS
jgi:hypothetical protein